MHANTRFCLIGCSLLTLLAAGAEAQPLAEAAPSGLSYASPLSGYRAWDDQKVNSWRESNERVERIGGWRAYSREAQAVNTADQPAGVPTTLPSGGHHGHHNGQHQQHMGVRP